MVFQKIEYYKISVFFQGTVTATVRKAMLNKDGALVSFTKKDLCTAEYPAPRPALKQYHHFIVFPLKMKAEMQMQCNGS